MNTTDLTHAGGVVYRRGADDGDLDVLLVRAKPAPHEWVLPKGHIEVGETSQMCARREVQEEAGVDAEPETLLGVDRYSGPRGPVVVAFYLMRFVGHVPPTEAREVRWVSFREVPEMVRFDSMRAIISDARRHLAGL